MVMENILNYHINVVWKFKHKVSSIYNWYNQADIVHYIVDVAHVLFEAVQSIFNHIVSALGSMAYLKSNLFRLMTFLTL